MRVLKSATIVAALTFALPNSHALMAKPENISANAFLITQGFIDKLALLKSMALANDKMGLVQIPLTVSSDSAIKEMSSNPDGVSFIRSAGLSVHNYVIGSSAMTQSLELLKSNGRVPGWSEGDIQTKNIAFVRSHRKQVVRVLFD